MPRALAAAAEAAPARRASEAPTPSSSPDAAEVVRLQRAAGNAAVARMLARCPDCEGECAEAVAGKGSPLPGAQPSGPVEAVDPAEAMQRIAAAKEPAELQRLAEGLKMAAAARHAPAAGATASRTLARQGVGGGGGSGGGSAGGFCDPYSVLEAWEAAGAKASLLAFLPAASTGMFQSTEVAGLWIDYLTHPSPPTRTFRGPASTIVRGFETAAVMLRWHRDLFNQAVNQLKATKPPLPPAGDVRVPVSSLLPGTDLAIDFSNPYDIPGHIAGGRGAGDAGADTRSISGDLIVRRQVDVAGDTTGFQVISDFAYHVHDTVDFCPGQAGSGLEQTLTIPLSRLEASGLAHDVPFDVFFVPAPLTADLAAGDLPTSGTPSWGDRDRRGRDPDRRETRDIRGPLDRRDEPPRAGERAIEEIGRAGSR